MPAGDSPLVPGDARRCSIKTRDEVTRQGGPGWRILGLVAASYVVCVAIATFPVVLSFGSALPGQLTDPLEHLWIMRWSEACLVEGKSPFFCPSLNAPTGVPLGYFPTMHLQTVAYLALGIITSSDVARFNLLWFGGFVATGLGTFLLAWWVVRSAWPSWLAGLGGMLGGPMLMHAHGHLETMQMGAVPLFLIAWIRFLDRPDRLRMGVALGLYWLVVASAPYFAVLAIFPAAWAVAWACGVSTDRRAWIKEHAGWLIGFGLASLPGLILLFSSQIWATAQGFPMARTRSEFNRFGAPPWSSFVPSPWHRLGRTGLAEVFERTGYSSRMSECSSYIGVVTLTLLAYAALARVRFDRRGFWWSTLALMIVLSWGSSVEVGSWRIPMPAGWIYGIFPPFHLIRVPARFNLFALVIAAVPAAAAVRDLLGRVGCPHRRMTLAITLALVSLADLAMVPFETSVIPPMPTIYRDLASKNPGASLVDAPLFGSNEGQVFSSLWGYWQSIHRLKTTAGYPGVPNVTFESEIVRSSPFAASRLLDEDSMRDVEAMRFGPVAGVFLRDYAWLYLTAHGFDQVVWHRGAWFDPKYSRASARVQAELAGGKVFEDADVIVFARDRLERPGHLTWLCGEGIRQALGRADPQWFGVLREARLVVYVPEADQRIQIRLEGVAAFAHQRDVRLVEAGRELARWTVEPGEVTRVETPAIALTSGLHELRLLSDSDDRPSHYADRIDDARTAYSLKLRSVRCGDRPFFPKVNS